MSAVARVLLVTSTLLLAAPAAGEPNAWALVAADAAVASSAPDTVLAPNLDLVSNSVHRSFVSFRLPDPDEMRILSATLVLQVRTSPSTPRGRHEVRLVAADSWSESTLTWNTQPAASEGVGVIDAGLLPPGGEARLDVSGVTATAQLADRRISFRIAPEPGSTDANLRFRPRESYPSVTLEFTVDPAPRLSTGDLVRIDISLPMSVIASEPASLIDKQLASLDAPWNLIDLDRDPIDGSYVALDAVSHRLFRIDPVSGALRLLQQDHGLGWGSRIDVGPDGTTWVSTWESHAQGSISRLYRLDRDTGSMDLVSEGGMLATPFLFALDPVSGAIYCTVEAGPDDAPAAIVRVDALTGTQALVSSGGHLNAPLAIAAGESGLWVIDGPVWEAELLRIDAVTGAQTRVAALPESAGQLALEPGGTIVVAANEDVLGGIPGGAWIARFDPATGALSSWLEETDSSIAGIVIETDGSWTVGVRQYGGGTRISRIDPSVPREIPGLGWIDVVGPSFVEDISLDRRRHLLMLETSSSFNGGSRLLSIDPRTGLQRILALTRPLAPASENQSRRAFDVAQAADGRTFLAEWIGSGSDSQVLEVVAPGVLATRYATADLVTSLAIARDGALLLSVADGSQSTLRSVDPDDGSVAEPADPIPLRHARLEIDARGDVFASGQGSLLRLDSASGAWIPVASTDLTSGAFLLDGAGLAYAPGYCFGSAEARLTTRLDLATGAAEQLAICGGVAIARPTCADGFDNDRDGAIDWPADTSCASARDDSERSLGCGIGAELALLALGIAMSRRRRALVFNRTVTLRDEWAKVQKRAG